MGATHACCFKWILYKLEHWKYKCNISIFQTRTTNEFYLFSFINNMQRHLIPIMLFLSIFYSIPTRRSFEICVVVVHIYIKYVYACRWRMRSDIKIELVLSPAYYVYLIIFRKFILPPNIVLSRYKSNVAHQPWSNNLLWKKRFIEKMLRSLKAFNKNHSIFIILYFLNTIEISSFVLIFNILNCCYSV